DTCGNEASVNVQITVKDTIPPKFTSTFADTLKDTAVCAGPYFFNDNPGTSVIDDNCPLEVEKFGPGSGDTLKADTTYTIRYTAWDKDSNSVTDSFRVKVNPYPKHAQLIGDTNVCKNSWRSEYDIDLDTSKYEYFWEITGGTILAGKNTNGITVHWDTTASAYLTLRVTDTSRITDCAIVDTFSINKNKGTAPDTTSIKYKDGQNQEILVCQDTSAGLYYEWGYTDTSATPTDSVLQSDTLRYVILPDSFAIDDVDYVWVDTYFYDNYPGCITRSYLDSAPDWNVNVEEQMKSGQALKFYPNPVNKRLYIEDINLLEYNIGVFNISGKKVPVEVNKNYIRFPDYLPAGMYIFRLQNQRNVFTGKIILTR
ncbi:MAG: T9SS type A sorting domain-containing protein, partial [bacterium]